MQNVVYKISNLLVCNHTPTHNIPAHSQRRLFELGHLLHIKQLVTEEIVLEGCTNSNERFSFGTRS